MTNDDYSRLYRELEEIKRNTQVLEDRNNSVYVRFIDTANKLLIPAVIAIFGWVWNIDRTVSKHQLLIDRNVTELSVGPPEWLREDILDMKRDMRALSSEFAIISQKLTRVEVEVSSNHRNNHGKHDE